MTDVRQELEEQLHAIAGPVSRETFERLLAFEVEFRRWNARINLAAPSTLAEIWPRHILDSAQLLPLRSDAKHWVDLGSGGGFPGAILAVLLAERGESRIDLVESNQKKAAFLQSVLTTVGVSAKVHRSRIEACYQEIPACDVVTARALAPLGQLFDLAAPWLQSGAIGLFHKGRDYEKEIAESRDGWTFDLIEHVSRIDPAGRVLECRNLERRARNDKERR